MLNIGKIIFAIAFVMKVSLSFAQDKIYKKEGGIIECKITDVVDEKVFYKGADGNGVTKEIKKSEIDIIKYDGGKVVDYSVADTTKRIKEETKPEKKFDRNSDEFVNYANSLARQMSQSILLKMAGRVENSSVAVYFDSVYKDMMTGEINIPIIIKYEKYNALNNGFIKGTIKVKPDGSKVWVFENAGND